jgi:hypothetical protein
MKSKINECDGCVGSPNTNRDSVSVNSSYNSDNDEKSVTVTARNSSADELMQILKLSGIMPTEQIIKSEIAPVPKPAQPVTGLSAVVVGESWESEGFIDRFTGEDNFGNSVGIDEETCGVCGEPLTKGINAEADESQLCPDCYKYLHGEESEGSDLDSDKVEGEYDFDDDKFNEQDDFETYNQNEADDYMNESEEYDSLAGGAADCEKCGSSLDPNENYSPSNVLHGKRYCDNCFTEFQSGRANPTCALCHENETDVGEKFCSACASGEDMFEGKEATRVNRAGAKCSDEGCKKSARYRLPNGKLVCNNHKSSKKINESSGYYIQFQRKDLIITKFYYAKLSKKLQVEYTTTKEEATIFDLDDAKKYAITLKSYPMVTNVAIKPVNTVEESKMNEALSPKRENTGLNGAPKSWQNEPNEQIAGWRALVQDADGPNNPKDMFNPVKGSDNIETVARNKRHPKLHEDSEINALAEKLHRQFSTLEETRVAATVAKKKEDRPEDFCKAKKCLYRTKEDYCPKHKPEKVTEGFCIYCTKRTPANWDSDLCKSCQKKEDSRKEGKKKVSEDNNFVQRSEESWNKIAEKERPKEEFLRHNGWTSKVITAPNQRKQLMWTHPDKPGMEYSTINAWQVAVQQGVKESMYHNGNIIVDPESTNSMSDKSDRFKPNARVYNAINGETGVINKIEGGIVFVRTRYGIEKWDINKTHTLVGEGKVTEAISKSQTKKLQDMLDTLEKKVKKLSAPPSPKTKITQSLERFEEKIQAIKDALKKRTEKGSEDKEDAPEKKGDEKKEAPTKKEFPAKKSDDKPKSEKKPFEKKSDEDKSKSEKSEKSDDSSEDKPKDEKSSDSDKEEKSSDSEPKGKSIKDIGKGIYETSEVEKMQGFRKLLEDIEG